MRRRLAATAGLILLAALVLPAQEKTTPQTFTAGTELVLVDFVVSDKADHLVGGLSAKDFVVKEDGKERPIVKFEAFGAGDASASATGAAARGAAPAAPLPAGITPQNGDTSTVLLVDDGQLAPEQASRLRPALKELLGKMGARSGTLMLVAPNSKVSVVGTLPTAAADLAVMVDKIVGQRVEDHSTFPVADAEAYAVEGGDDYVKARVGARFVTLNPGLIMDQAVMLARNRAIDVAHEARSRRDSMYAVSLLCLDWLAARPGRHSMIVVSGGFAREQVDTKYQDVVTRSLRANAPIHFLDARGLQGIGRYAGVQYGPALSRNADEGPFGWVEAAEGSALLADETGGVVVGNSNDLQKGLGRLLDAMQTYYILAYQPPAHDKPGYRKIKVEVRTKGLNVRARRGYYSGAPAPH